MRKFALLLTMAAAHSASFAQEQGEVSITIYNNNLALVQDIRNMDLPAGRTRQEFPDVSAQIRPETVTLGGEDIAIIEQNFDYDLLSPDALMENAVGERITIVRFNPATGQETRERAEVLAVNGGVVLEIDGRIEVLRDDGRPARVVFDEIPPNLRARPTLSVTMDSARRSTRPLSLSYLTPGTQTADREQLGDFYLYPIAERTTIANRQTKQVNFLDVQGARAENAYAFRVGGFVTQTARNADSVLRFSSSRDGGLGDALPAGTVRVYMRDARGDPQFIGENSIPHTPMGSELAINTGQAFDVNVATTQVERTRLGRFSYRTRMQYNITSAIDEPIRVQLDQMSLPWGWSETRIINESLDSERLSADGTRWLVDVPANGSVQVTATFHTRY